MTQEITIIVDTITGGFHIVATPVGKIPAQGYCAKPNQIAQRIKELVAPVFAEKKEA